jgi:hypothetical protein
MRPGDTLNLVVMRQTAAGAASAGKVLADFTIQAYADGVAYDCDAAITDVATTGSWRVYKLEVTLQTGGPYWSHIVVQVASGTDIVTPTYFCGEVEQQDLDSTYDVVGRPTAQLGEASRLSSEVQLEVIAYRESPLYFSIVDQSGAAIDLSGYDNWRFSVWDKTHSGSILYSDAISLTGSAGGVVEGVIPEDAAFFSEIADAFTNGEDFVTLYYDIIADAAADNDRTQTILRGRLILHRYEGAP